MNIYDVTIGRGEDIRAGLTAYICEKGWDNVWIAGAIGSVKDMVFTTPSQNTLPLCTEQKQCRDAAELLTFTGEVMKIEQMDPELKAVYQDLSSPLFMHIHASCAACGGKIFGGGLLSGRAFRAVRVFLVPLERG